jgi:protein tyrosine phosphatase (PTP) superfamily phosphohydrolase (DUF442 family)
MTTPRIEGAPNFRSVDETLLTSGQPDEAQLAAARQAGVEVVINLALHDDPRYSLADERGTVEGLGMSYRHIPVPFAHPTESDLLVFFAAMKEAQGRRIFVHCAANHRVTAFLGLYRRLCQGWALDRAFELMATVWTPDPVWAAFIESMLRMHGG